MRVKYGTDLSVSWRPLLKPSPNGTGRRRLLPAVGCRPRCVRLRPRLPGRRTRSMRNARSRTSDTGSPSVRPVRYGGTSSPPYSLAAGAARSLRVGVPVSTTRRAGTEVVPTGSAVFAGVTSGQPILTFLKPRTRMLQAAFQSRSASNPQVGHECSRTHSGFSVSTPQAAHSLYCRLYVDKESRHLGVPSLLK